MQAIKAKVGLSAERVQEMGRRSDQIGAIVETIEDIASQTNLLALNAANEAARAGEHGKGFAVVADEVRKLAERASGATKEIGGLIKGIQTTVNEAVAAMNEGAREVEGGVSRANEAGQALNDILTAVEAPYAQAEQAASAEEMSAQVEEVSASAQSLAEMAQALQQIVARFKLSAEAQATIATAHHDGQRGAGVTMQRSPGGNGAHKVADRLTPQNHLKCAGRPGGQRPWRWAGRYRGACLRR
ncbi:MAG: methyl-accepting chemotaxis protein [Chloroflexi bacterium]|nr:methyl-accepting chemotaxis protein [Chloroflexota bacterium]